jgi:hypothetical protein
MKRRTFIAALGGAATWPMVAWGLCSRTAQKATRTFLLVTIPPRNMAKP